LQYDGAVSVKWFGAVGDGVSDDWEAFQNALNTKKNLDIPKPSNHYKLTKELLLITTNQQIIGAGSGSGLGNDTVKDYVSKTDLRWYGTGVKYLHTRRQPRLSALDPTDDLMSTCINVQAEGVVLKDFSITLDEADYSDNNDYGADWDVGLFNGCRGQMITSNVHVVGYHRIANYYQDVTRAYLLSELQNPEGIVFPRGTVYSGCDGITHYKPYWCGGRWAEVRLGAIRDVSATYWNEETEALVSDGRGGSGASDYVVHDGNIRGGEHHSDTRWTDPDSTVPLYAGNEGFSSGAQYIDAYAGIASGRISKQTYYNCRILSEEPFITRLDRVGLIRFNDCHWEWKDREVYATDGVTEIDPTDMENYGYGTVSVTTNTGSVSIENPSTNNPSEEHFWLIDSLVDANRSSKKVNDCDSGLSRSNIGVTTESKGYIRSGVYTPILNGVTNVESSSENEFQWLQVGNVVTVSGSIGLKSAALGDMQIDISLPVSDSNFSANYQASGMISPLTSSEHVNGAIFAISSSQNVRARVYMPTTSTRVMMLHFQNQLTE
jgi:hypothetical protein